MVEVHGMGVPEVLSEYLFGFQLSTALMAIEGIPIAMHRKFMVRPKLPGREGDKHIEAAFKSANVRL